MFRKVEIKIKSQFNPANCIVYFGSNKDLDTSYFTIAPNGVAYISKNGKDFALGDLKIQRVEDIWKNTSLIDKSKYWERSSWFMD